MPRHGRPALPLVFSASVLLLLRVSMSMCSVWLWDEFTLFLGMCVTP